jgi:DNA-binding MarR family transcriptional regulator
LVTLGDLDRSAGFSLRIAQLTAFERLFALLEPGRSGSANLPSFWPFRNNPGVRQGVLADLLKIKWPNMTKLVRGLEQEGLVERQIPLNDRRSVVLRLTRKGRDRVDALAAQVRRCDREALSMLDEAEYDQLLVLCRKIAGWPLPPQLDGSNP